MFLIFGFMSRFKPPVRAYSFAIFLYSYSMRYLSRTHLPRSDIIELVEEMTEVMIVLLERPLGLWLFEN